MATSNSLSQVPGAAAAWPRTACCRRFAYLVMLLGALALAVSGIGTFATGRAPMTQWVLMLHVGASPLFSVGLALVALTWTPATSRQGPVGQGLLGLLLTCGLLLILSGVLPMTPLFGTEGQHLLYLIHRYAGIAFGALLVLHLISLPASRR